MTTSAPKRPVTRILFIGNSFTSRHQMPRLIADIAAAAEPPATVVVGSIVAGGASLRRHWNAGIARESLAASTWDHVVLQEQSTLPIKSPKRYHENVRLFAPEIAKHRAQAWLYLTWSRQHVPEAQAQLTAAVMEIGAEVHARVVPVGTAWHEALRHEPAVALYADDGSHPSAAGSYLAACTFYVAMFDQRPFGHAVSDRLKIDRDLAARLHAYAWSTRDSSQAGTA